MKAKLFPILILFFIISSNINAQCVNGKKSSPIYETGALMVKEFDNAGAEIVRIEYDLIFTSKESFRNLYSEWEYTIVGFADQGVKDLNIKLYEYDELLDQWNLITEDITAEAFGIVSHKPEVGALYKVEVIVNEFVEGYNAARYGLMYVHE